MNEVLRNFLETELDADDCMDLLQTIRDNVRNALKDRISFNAFDVVIDGRRRIVRIDDILDVSESSSVELSTERFIGFLEERLRRGLDKGDAHKP